LDLTKTEDVKYQFKESSIPQKFLKMWYDHCPSDHKVQKKPDPADILIKQIPIATDLDQFIDDLESPPDITQEEIIEPSLQDDQDQPMTVPKIQFKKKSNYNKEVEDEIIDKEGVGKEEVETKMGFKKKTGDLTKLSFKTKKLSSESQSKLNFKRRKSEEKPQLKFKPRGPKITLKKRAKTLTRSRSRSRTRSRSTSAAKRRAQPKKITRSRSRSVSRSRSRSRTSSKKLNFKRRK
jgi:hypothetical protein